MFLQVLDAARRSLARGTTVDLSGFYVVFTSKLGPREAMESEHWIIATIGRYVLVRALQSLAGRLEEGRFGKNSPALKTPKNG